MYRGIRSFLLLFGLFLSLFVAYRAAKAMAAPGDLLLVMFHTLGLLVGIALAITALKLRPRLEPALPRWFRNEMEAPVLRSNQKLLARPLSSSGAVGSRRPWAHRRGGALLEPAGPA